MLLVMSDIAEIIHIFVTMLRFCTLGVQCCVFRVRIIGNDDQCSHLSGREDCGSRGSPRDRHTSLPLPPAGQGNIDQPHRYLEP